MDINKIKQIFDCLIQEAENNPEWKATNALKCAKKEILKSVEKD